MPRADDTGGYNPYAPIASSRTLNLSPHQLQMATIIYQVGQSMGMTTRDIQIGLITAMVESNLTNVDYGDRDSLGLFQQRPSQGWGTPQQVQDPVYAAKKFFTALKGLGDARYSMAMGDAAQAVQRSAFPERYAQKIPDMRSMFPEISRRAGDEPVDMDGQTFPTAYVSPSPLFAADTSLDTSRIEQAPPIPQINPDMLGAWGMADSARLAQQEALEEAQNSLLSGVEPIANPYTNQSLIQPLSQEIGGFEPGVDGWRKAVVQYAKSALGVPYVWGGTSLTSGVDCSGLLQAAYAKAGINIPRVSYQQANFGKRVPLDALQAGDFVAWDNSSRNVGADHIALYIGNGQIIEASRPGLPVRIRSLGSDEGAWGVKVNVKR